VLALACPAAFGIPLPYGGCPCLSRAQTRRRNPLELLAVAREVDIRTPPVLAEDLRTPNKKEVGADHEESSEAAQHFGGADYSCNGQEPNVW